MNAKVGSWFGSRSDLLDLIAWDRWGRPARLIVVLLKAASVVGAAFAGRHAYDIFSNDALAFDDALPWYGLAFGLLVYAAWSRAALGVLSWPARAIRYVRQHPLEMALLAAILSIGIFIRTWKYGTLPPSDFLCCEEAINAGVSVDIREGARPINYPLVRYSTAFGMWAFGDNTNGLRLPFVIFGIAAMVPFYLLMRELVRTPAALFATALYASLHVLGDTSIYFQAGLFATALYAFALVRGLKTANPLWWLVIGFLTALLSYEYEAFKMLPLVAVVFVGSALLYVLLWPPPWPLRALLDRTWALARRAGFPALIFALALGIALTPMFARRHHGEDIYIDAINRQKAGRTATGLERYFSPQWEEQLRWVIQIYTPFVEPRYPHGTSIDARGVIDKATSVLLWGGALAAAVAFWHRWRLLFLLWFVGGSLAFSVLVENFTPWRMVGFIPPGIVLAGFLVDDLWGFVHRRHRVLSAGLVGGLVVAVAFAFGANTLILRGNASDPGVLQAYAQAHSDIFATCRYLQTRPKDNFAHVALWSLEAWGLAQPRHDWPSERFSWRDMYFVCRGLQGATVPSGEEIWPPPRTVEQPLTLILSSDPATVTAWRKQLERAMPGLGRPAFTKDGPVDIFQLVGYELSAGSLSSWQGLRTTYEDGAGQLREEVVNPEEVALPGLPNGADARLFGLVHVPVEGEEGWALTVTGADGLVRIDGRPTFSSGNGQQQVTPRALSEGWHVVEATLRPRPAAATARFQWRLDDGGTLPAFRTEFFALGDLGGWLHTRALAHQSGSNKTLSRFDFEPHVALMQLTHPALSYMPPNEAWKFTDDTWTAMWHVPATGTYQFEVVSPGSDIELRLNGVAVPGEVVQTPDGANLIATYRLQVSEGDHALALRFRLARGNFVGGQLTARDAAGAEVELDVSPY